MNTVPEEFEQRIQAINDDRKDVYLRIQELILNQFPDVERLIWFNLNTYRRGKKWIALGYRKDGLSLYSERPDVVAAFKARNPRTKTGKGCINLTMGKEIPYADLAEVINSILGSD